ncbi:MAG TPA: thiamine pyrophosphate-binding protein, partial [Vicinamibacterales bacterium]
MSEKHSVDRRDFLKTAAVTGAAALGAGVAEAANQAPQTTPPAPAGAPAPASAPVTPREVDPSGTVEVLTTDRPGGDFMVDVIKTLNFEFVASNPGSSFRGIHESIINYGNNTKPEFITCCHEESAVAMAHGYFKAEGR